MIHKAIVQKAIKDLVDDIKLLSSENLELVGNRTVSILSNQAMVHHGLNLDYRPSGYTVDSFSQNSQIIAEYSVESDYFKNKGDADNPRYPKIEKDIKHALAHTEKIHPQKIYLISSQEENPSFRSNFNKTPLYISYGKIIEILDARELAKAIYQQSVGSSTDADFYKQYFTSLFKNLDSFEYYGRLPAQCNHHVNDSETINALEKHFNSGENICVLSDVSGAGKTEAAISYVHHKKDEYQNYIWITGDDWKEKTGSSHLRV